MLAGLHDALADFPAEDKAAPVDSTDPAVLIDSINSLIERIDQVQQPSEHEAWARHHLQTKASWIATHAFPTWQQTPDDPNQLVHGDYLHTNLFFAITDVSAVIDWDKAEVRWPIDEIIRACDLSLQMRPDLCRAMIDGYRLVRPLALEDLDRSANNWSLSMLSSQWLFVGIYVDNNDPLRNLLEPGPFVPFIDHWARVRSNLS